MIFVSVVKAVTSAEKQTANCKQNRQYRQNYFEIEHVFRYLDELSLILTKKVTKVQRFALHLCDN
jgi:hypothetical protein